MLHSAPKEQQSSWACRTRSPTQNGYFTGLKTEWYHGAPYYINPQETDYTNLHLTLFSGWFWMDEFNANPRSNQLVFASNTSAPISFNPPNTIQEFSLNGTTEYADAFEFVTGAAGSVTSTSTSTSSSASTSTTSTASTTTITVPVTTTMTSTAIQTATQTVTLTAPTTVTQTATSTFTQPVTTTLTTTQPTTDTVSITVTAPSIAVVSTQTVTQTQSSTSTTTQTIQMFPTWGYAAILVLLIVGLAVGYLVKGMAIRKG